MVVTIFRTRLRPEHADEYAQWAGKVKALAVEMPGFVAHKSFTADDGERVSIVEFESEQAHQAWREHPMHREAQRLGRERFYSEYQVHVCVDPRSYGFFPGAGKP